MLDCLLATCLTVAISAAPQGAEEETKSVLRVWPVHAALATTPATDSLPLRSFYGQHGDAVRLVGSAEPICAIEPDLAIMLVKDFAGGEAVFDCEGGMSLEYVDGGALVGWGPADKAVSTGATLRKLTRLWTRSLRVSAKLYEWRGKTNPRGVVTADQLAELTRGLQPSWAANVRTRSGHPVQLGGLRRTPFLIPPIAEADAEERARMQHEGAELVVQPQALLGTDELVVFCQLALASGAGPNGAAAAVPGPLTIDAAVMSARIADGGALVYCAHSATDAGRSALLTVQCRWLERRPESPADALVAPVGALATGVLGAFIGLDDDGLPNRESDEEGRALAFDSDKLQDLLRSHVTPERWDEDGTTMYASRGVLYVHAADETRRGVELMLREQESLWLRNTRVELDTRLVGTGAGEAETLHRVSFPALSGRAHVFVHGVERMAGGRGSLRGIVGVVEPWDTDDERGARVELALHVPGAANRDFVRFQHSGVLREQDALDFGDGPAIDLGGKTRRTRQMLRVLWR